MSIKQEIKEKSNLSKRTGVLTQHFTSLDGMRGLCALWVLFGHTLSMTGPHSKIWSLLEHPLLGVDVFIVLSGFLMLVHYSDRHASEPWDATSTWIGFWLRRTFRVAPLYYVAILAAVLFRSPITLAWDTARPDLDYLKLAPGFFVQHLTFVFGLIPGAYWSRPLPDWSLSLEMQFYAVFPFIALFWRRVGALPCVAILTAACVASAFLLPGYFASFELPSALPAKLPVFFSGMLIAAWARPGAMRHVWLPVMAVALSFLPLPNAGGAPSMVSRAILIAVIVFLVAADMHAVPSWLQVGARLFYGRFASFLGMVSYGVYLAHFPLLMLLHSAIEAHFPYLAASLRLTLLLATLIPATYAIAYLGHIWVERPGIRLGRLTLGRLYDRKPKQKTVDLNR